VKERHLRRRAGDERGQVVVILAVMLVVLLGMAALVVDIGYAYYVQRTLQASTDAASLAGAQDLPDPALAESRAHEYGGSPGSKNYRGNIPGVTTDVSTKCISVSPCSVASPNAIVVTESVTLPTKFAKIFGIDHFTVNAKATACNPCASAPLDVMLVLDRTGSMCQDHDGHSDPSCTDLNNAKEGVRTFLQILHPAFDKVGLAVFPPATSISNRCGNSSSNNYDSSSAQYVVVPLSQDFQNADGSLNSSSNLVSTNNCLDGGGGTAYANALEAAQAELDAHGRSNVQDIIVFLSDGAANTGPGYYSQFNDYRRRPCNKGVASADTIKTSRGTKIYSIGYDLDASNGGANVCERDGRNGSPGGNESPAITAYHALELIATDATTFYNQPDPGELNTIFSRVASDIVGSALVDNNQT
jgi:Putative Flp pilus-assembly TadE/G-like